MSKKIVVIKSHSDEKNLDLIRETAAKYGYSAEFYTSLDEALPHLEDAEIVQGQGGRGMATLKASPNVKWYCAASAGVNEYDPDYVEQRGILFSNSTGTYGTTISEHIIMVALMIMRRMFEYEEYRVKSEWQDHWIDTRDIGTLAGSRIVVLGTGNLGSTFAERVKSFQPASIIGVSRSGNPVEGFDKIVKIDKIESVLPEADLLVMCLPGTKETENIMNKERISLLSKNAILINVGRGTAIDDEALMDALENDRLAAASLDVFREEPLPSDSPLWTTKHLYVTPHISGQETAPITREINARMFCEDIENYCQGKPLKYAVDLRRGY